MTEASGFDLDFQILDEPLELPEEEPEDDLIKHSEVQVRTQKIPMYRSNLPL